MAGGPGQEGEGKGEAGPLSLRLIVHFCAKSFSKGSGVFQFSVIFSIFSISGIFQFSVIFSIFSISLFESF